MSRKVPFFEHPDDFHTHLQYDFFPDAYLAESGMDVNTAALKGAITYLRWLPRSRAFYAKAAVAPVKIHPLLNVLTDVNVSEVGLPSGLSHRQVGVFSTSSLNSYSDEATVVAEAPYADATPEQVQSTLMVANALSRRLMVATVDAASRYAAGEFDPTFPTGQVDSQGPIELQPGTYKVTSYYQPPRK